MYGVVRPVAEAILPKTALSRQSRGPVTTDATYATRSTDTTDAAYTTNTAGPANTTDAANSAHTTDSPNTAYAPRPTHTADAAGDGVAIKAVEVVDIDIATAPAAPPAPTAAPPGSHHHSRAEGERRACRIVAGRIRDRRIWIRSFTVYSSRLIRGHIYDFRICWLYDNYTLVFNYSRFHGLLLSGVQSALALRLPAHALNGIHQIALLRQEGIAEIGSPLKVISQQFHDLR